MRFSLFVLCLLVCISCKPPSNSDFYFTGKASNLLLEASDLPPQWKIEITGEQPLKDAMGWTRIFTNSDTRDRGTITNAVVVFDQKADAIEYWDHFYDTQKKVQRAPCVDPPHNYRSKFADEFEFFCTDLGSIPGIFAYEYSILARYGNVIASISAVVVNDADMTVIQAGEAGVLRWTELETLLKRLDEKFQDAMSN
jgi:hypothetical protein